MMALYFQRDRFEKLDSGHVWLSETPKVAGSKGWDTSLPRMVTWVKLKDRQQEHAMPIVFFNTHFDHQGPEARRQSSLLIRGKAFEAAAECRIIVTGDFNAAAAPDSDPYTALFDDADGAPSPVVDSLRVHNPVAAPNEGTFSSFRCSATTGTRIDWIAVSRDWMILDGQIDRTQRDGRTPSDHYPVTAVLRGLR
jgi:endonuclease/exonuclease/phosphatase family metal-dependent hydrolase